MDEDTIFRILLDRTKEEDLLRQFQETSTKPNIDILLKVSTDSACIRVNTSVLRYSKVLDEMFDMLGFEEQKTVVPLYEDEEGTISFALFYWWAIRDPRFSITEENLSQLLVFADKYDVPLLVKDIVIWTRQQHLAHVDLPFCTVMLCHCLKFTYLRDQLNFWYETIVSTKSSSELLLFLASPAFKTHLGCDALHKVVIGLARALANSKVAEVKAAIDAGPITCARNTTRKCNKGHRLCL